MRERLLRRLDVLVILRRRNVADAEIVVLIARLRIDQADADQLFRMRKGKAAQHDRVDDRELRHRAADAEREHEHGEKTKNFVLQQDAKTDTNILAKRFENHDGLLWLVDDPAVAQLDDAVAVGGVGFRMRDLDNGGAVGIQFLEELHDFLALTGVEIAGRLVGERSASDWR